MTLTFKDERGYECTLALIGSTQGGYVRDATLADLLRALGLSTEGGPSDDELRALNACGFFDTLQADITAPLSEPESDGLRTVWNDGHYRGSASRQPEVDRLTAEVVLLKRSPVSVREQQRAERAEAMVERVESELAATKEKLAEVERELDRARRVVEAAHNIAFHSDEHAGMRDIDVVSCRASAGEVRALREALASAGTDADRTEAPKCEQRAGCRASKHSDDSDPIAWLLRHESVNVRWATAEGIWQAESVAHLPALRAAAEREKVPRVRDYMLHAAGLLEASAPERQPEVKRDDGQP